MKRILALVFLVVLVALGSIGLVGCDTRPSDNHCVEMVIFLVAHGGTMKPATGYLNGTKVALTGEYVKKGSVKFVNNLPDSYELSFAFNSEGTELLEQITSSMEFSTNEREQMTSGLIGNQLYMEWGSAGMNWTIDRVISDGKISLYYNRLSGFAPKEHNGPEQTLVDALKCGAR